MKKFFLLFVLLLMTSVFLNGCIGKKTEKERFIDATVEATCLVFQSENIFDSNLEEDAKKIYRDNDFDADNDEYMTSLTKKYESDPDVQAAITKALKECAGDLATGLEKTEEGTSAETPAK